MGQALAQDERLTQRNDIILLLLTNDSTVQEGSYVPQGRQLLSAMLLSYAPDSSGSVRVLSISPHTRVLHASSMRYTTLSQVYGGGNGVEDMVESVRYLLGGAEVRGCVVLTPKTAEAAADVAGGIQIPLSTLSASTEIMGENSLVYPTRSDNDVLASFLKSVLNRINATPDYDIDVGRAMRSFTPSRIEQADASQVRLSGSLVSGLLSVESSAYSQIDLHHSILYALLRKMKDNPDPFAVDFYGYEASGVTWQDWTNLLGCSLSYNEGRWLQGTETTVGSEVQLLPDSQILSDWILNNLYGVSR